MNAQHITSPDDPRVAVYRDLIHKKSARAADCFIVEGRRLVQRMLQSDWPVQSVFLEPRLVDWVKHLAEPMQTETTDLFTADREMLAAVAGFPFHRGAMACVRRPPKVELHSLVETDLPICLAAAWHVNETDNVGGLVRTAAALGIQGLLVDPQTADPFSRRAIRVSMGSILRLPIVEAESLAVLLTTLQDAHDFEIVAAALSPNALPLPEYQPARRTVVVMGNENAGLPPAALELADHIVQIPMATGVSSLNVTVAAGILLNHVALAHRQM